MTRTRTSAKKAGSQFERQIANYLATHLDDRIDRRVKNGTKDRGDIGGVRTRTGNRVVIECKNTTRTNLSSWIQEAQIEAKNDDATIGVIAHKRHGKANPAEQWITMTLQDFAYLLGANPPEYDN